MYPTPILAPPRCHRERGKHDTRDMKAEGNYPFSTPGEALRTSRQRALKILNVVFWGAVAVSIIHYSDNYLAYDSFPQTSSGPNPSATTILVAWVVLTAFGLAGYFAFRRGHLARATGFLAVYSLSGLIGVGHYAAPGMTEVVWWRQAHVIADIAFGAAILAFAAWSLLWLRRMHSDS